LLRAIRVLLPAADLHCAQAHRHATCKEGNESIIGSLRVNTPSRINKQDSFEYDRQLLSRDTYNLLKHDDMVNST